MLTGEFNIVGKGKESREIGCSEEGKTRETEDNEGGCYGMDKRGEKIYGREAMGESVLREPSGVMESVDEIGKVNGGSD